MKKSLSAYWKGFLGVLGAATASWLLSRLSKVREPAIAILFRVTPTSRAVLPIAVSLCLLGFLCLSFAVGIYLFRAIKVSRIRRRALMSPEALTVDDVAYLERLRP